MPNQIKVSLKLYFTTNCHLCEQAVRLLLQVEKNNLINWSCSEIAYDEELLLKYETKIPVLFRVDNQAVLYWPFSYQQIQSFIN